MEINGKNDKKSKIKDKDFPITKIVDDARKNINFKGEEVNDERALELIDEYILNKKELKDLDFNKLIEIEERLFVALRKPLDILQEFADDKSISEIMVNGKDNIFIERDGKIQKTKLQFDSREELEEVISRIAGKVNREINTLNPIVDARLEDGSRVNAVYKNIAIGGPILTIRKFPQKAIDMDRLIDIDTISKEASDFLVKLVKCKYNIFISGGTSSGKTTFLNVLTDFVPSDERVIVIEDSAELRIRKIDNLVRMECKKANSQGKGSIEMDQLIKSSLRMRPDRIIVGEVRGKEVIDMLQAMNTGHDGSISTGHGNSIKGMLKRLETMMLQGVDFPIEALRGQIAEGIDIIIHLGRIKGKGRKVLEIAEVLQYEGGDIKINSLFKYCSSEGLLRTQNRLINKDKIMLNGDCDEE